MGTGQATSAMPWTVRAAGWLVLLVGAANTAVAVVAASVSGVAMQPVVTTGLVVAGGVTAWLGWRILRGTEWALAVALAAFAILLLARIAFVDGADQPIGAATSGGVSQVLLIVIVCVLGIALAHRRHLDRHPDR